MYKLSIFYKKGVKLYRPTEEEVKRRRKEYKRIRLEETIEKILKRAKKREDGKYDIYGDVILYDMQLRSLLELPIKFGKVYGDFSCSSNQLVSLEGGPEYVDGYFSCYGNQLKDLKGAPEYVGGDFDCSYNQLMSLEGAPKYVKGDFSCYGNQLKDLKGAPEYVGKSFYCNNNQLVSLEGVSKYIAENFWCNNNQLVSLEGAPAYVGGNFYIYNNRKKFTEEEVRKVVNVKGNVYV